MNFCHVLSSNHYTPFPSYRFTLTQNSVWWYRDLCTNLAFLRGFTPLLIGLRPLLPLATTTGAPLWPLSPPHKSTLPCAARQRGRPGWVACC